MSKNAISCIVYNGTTQLPWLASVVYGPHNRAAKRNFWTSIGDIASRFVGPWLIIGDYNIVLRSSERIGGRNVDDSANMVLNALDDMGMIELQASGGIFSWQNRHDRGVIYSKIDRGMANAEWWAMFPNASLSFLLETTFDHRPLILRTHLREPFIGRPLRFEAVWTRDPRSHAVNGIMNENNREWDKSLRRQLEELLKREELLWFQKSRVRWVLEGDKCTKFFFISTLDIGMAFLNKFHEVNVVFSMGDYKAPGPDGLSVVFFKTYWSTVGRDVICMVRHFFLSCFFHQGINATNVRLIGSGNGIIQNPHQAGPTSPTIEILTRLATMNTTTLTTVLGFDRIPIVSHYLGLPLFWSNKISDFSFLMDKLDRKLVGWKSKFLSIASHQVFIKAASLAVPSYAMQAIGLPKTVCNRIDAKIRRFWWGIKDENFRPLYLRAWESLCIPKSFGGLGLRRSAEMNRALLAKWCWNLLSGHTSWCLSLLRGKYLRDNSFLCVVAKPTDSLFLKSILAVKPLILKGVCIHIGRGDWVDLLIHPWVSKHLTFCPKPTCTRQPGV
ncbi:hypothetical protein UlMin_032101 [Ulmus minor]